jgi:hypothetical protein
MASADVMAITKWSISGLEKRPTPGRSPDWLKVKNPEASAVKREAEEDWGKKR